MNFLGGSSGLPPRLILPSCNRLRTASESCLFCLPRVYLGLFVDLGRTSSLEAEPVLSALSGQALTPAGLWTALRPRIYKRHWSEGQREARGNTGLDHTAVKPVSLCNLRVFCECIQVNSAVTSASFCLIFSQQSEGEIQEDPPCCVFLQEVQIEMERSQNLDSQPQGSV